MANKFYKIGAWVPDEARAEIRWCYEGFTNGYEITKNRYWQVAYASIEQFASNKDLEDFWKKCRAPGKMAQEMGLVFHHYDLQKPAQNRADFKRKMVQVVGALKAISGLIESDPSVHSVVSLALGDMIGRSFFKPKPQYLKIPDEFIDDLIKKIEEWSANPNRGFGRNIGVAKTAERTFFIKNVWEIYKGSFGRSNKRQVAKILNVIRPDLGRFSDIQVDRALRQK
jgi:hypothetical protein